MRLVDVPQDALFNQRIAYFASTAANPEVYLTPHEIVLNTDTSAACAAKRCAVTSLDACVDASGMEPRGSKHWQELVTSFVASQANKKPRRRSSVLLNVRKIRKELDDEKRSRLTLIANEWTVERAIPKFEEFTQKELARRASLSEPAVSKILHDASFADLLRGFNLINDPEMLWKVSSKSLRK